MRDLHQQQRLWPSGRAGQQNRVHPHHVRLPALEAHRGGRQRAGHLGQRGGALRLVFPVPQFHGRAPDGVATRNARERLPGGVDVDHQAIACPRQTGRDEREPEKLVVGQWLVAVHVGRFRQRVSCHQSCRSARCGSPAGRHATGAVEIRVSP